jgi:hypothetical protein
LALHITRRESRVQQLLELRVARDAAERDEHVARADALADGASAVGHGALGRSVQPLQLGHAAAGGRKCPLLDAIRHSHQRLVRHGHQRLVRHNDEGLVRYRPGLGFGFGFGGRGSGPGPRRGDSGPGLRRRQLRLRGGNRRLQCLRLRHRRLNVQPHWFRDGSRRRLLIVRYAASHGHRQRHA